MQNRRIYQKRLEQFHSRIAEHRYGTRVPLAAEITVDKKDPIPHASLGERSWKPIGVGKRWGELFGSAWFRFTGTVPKEFAGQEVMALIDVGGEGCVFVDGSPELGLTDIGSQGGYISYVKRRVPLHKRAKGGEPVEILVEAAANAMFGALGHRDFTLKQAELVVFNRAHWQFALDVEFMLELADSLPEDSVRGRKILAALNQAANVYGDGTETERVEQARQVVSALFDKRADASAPTCWSVGHAHLDLGWLWPVRETRRKAGRTFSTALKLLQEYPDYIFGASQPQAYEWVKNDYPKLYKRVKKAVADGRWEPQGAMWVEPDMNVPSGESLVRQCLYGIRFFREEFGLTMENLWLPDVFGYSAALPQILAKSGVKVFMTQKISWNETNIFPHHTFYWEGIDGTRILSHFLPSNNYNLDNTPKQLRESMGRFAQADVQDDFLNLFGIGDGGGGPGRRHLEFARRAADCEGLPKVKQAAARDFFKRILKTNPDDLPLWVGELYLELHRGTYTTQARIKQENRQLELKLRDVEFLSVLAGSTDRAALSRIWKDTLLHQFHDILPGSSIAQVYKDAHRVNGANLAALDALQASRLAALHGKPVSGTSAGRAAGAVVYNTLSWHRDALVFVPWAGNTIPTFRDPAGEALPSQPTEGGFVVPASIPPMGYTTIEIGSPKGADSAPAPSTKQPVTATRSLLENRVLRVELAADGTITSIYDKEHGRETLAGAANELLVWEDHPYSWDAWDISHYYRETIPQSPSMSSREVSERGPLRASVSQTLRVGSSEIRQRIVLEAESRMVRIECEVDWHESHKVLRVQARPAIQAQTATYEIQFGVVERPTHANTSWDQAKFEVPGQRFADVSQPDYGMALMNTAKYGHYVRDGVMDLALIRSSIDPDPEADRGTHQFTYAYYPHALSFPASDVFERAHELNAQCAAWLVKKLPTQRSASHFAVSGGGVKIETVKHAEDGDAVILRLYETRGATRGVGLLGRAKWSRAEEVNLIEEKPKKLSVKVATAAQMGSGPYQSRIDLTFKPFEIRTIRVEVAE